MVAATFNRLDHKIEIEIGALLRQLPVTVGEAGSLFEPVIVPVVKIQRLHGTMPRYQSDHAAGVDLVAALDEPLVLAPLARDAIPTGIAVEIPAGFEGQVRPRSGRALQEGLTVCEFARHH